MSNIKVYIKMITNIDALYHMAHRPTIGHAFQRFLTFLGSDYIRLL